MKSEQCIACGNRATWIGAGVNLLLVALKLVIGITSGSKACLADALHSGVNLITAFLIIASRRTAGKPTDERHPYGYGKTEFIAAAAVGGIIVIFAVVLVFTSLRSVVSNSTLTPHPIAALCALISVLANEVLFRYLRCVGTELRSQIIVANAWANRADGYSSTVVLLGVIGAQFGLRYLDPIAAILVGAIIVKVAIDCLKQSVAGLMDGSVRPETLHAIADILRGVEDVQGVRHVRGRLVGDKIWVDVGIQIASRHTINECEQIRQTIAARIQQSMEEIGKVFIDFNTAEGR